MVVDAHSTRKPKGKKGRRNKLIIGEDEPDGTVVQDKGRLNAIRFAPETSPRGARDHQHAAGVDRPDPQGRPRVLFSQELTGLERNDQLAAFGTMGASIESIPYNVLNRTR